MKKILFMNFNEHTKGGGVEKFAWQLMSILDSSEYEVHEFCFNTEPNSKSARVKLSHVIQHIPEYKNNECIFKIYNEGCKFLNKLISDNNFDLFIDNVSSNLYTNVKIDPNKTISMQHFSIDSLRSQHIFFKRTKWRHFFEVAENVITYTKKDAESLQKIFGEKNVIVRPYTCDPQKNQIILPKILSEIPKIFISIRLNSSQKNLKFLLKMSNYLKYKIDIYGSNPPKNFEQTLQKKYKNLNYKGTYTNSMIQDIYNSYDFSLLVSKFEGWPFVSTESIQYGCPTILRNTFPSAEFFTANNNGLLIPKKFNPKRAALLINEYIENMKPEEYSKISERCIELAKENLLFEKWKKEWLEIISKY